MNRSEFRKDYERTTRKYEQAFMPRISRALTVQYKGVIEVLERTQDPQAAMNYLNGTAGNEALTAVVRQLYRTVGLSFARKNYSRLLKEVGQKSAEMRMEHKQFGFNDQWTAFIDEYLRKYLIEKITFEVSENTRNWLLRIIQNGVASGDSYDQIVDTLGKWPGREYRSARIVRTEVNRAANVGAKAMSSTASYEMQKEWSSATDWRVRGTYPNQHANHVALNGTVIDENDYFIDPRNGDRLEFPGDVNASGKSTINCRCSVAYTAKRDSLGNLVPKRKTTAVIYPSQQPRRQIVTI